MSVKGLVWFVSSLILGIAVFGRLHADSLGNNGYQMEPLLVSVTSSPGPSILSTQIPSAQFDRRCADDDGCKLRITSIADGERALGETLFALDSATRRWTSVLPSGAQLTSVDGDSTVNAAAGAEYFGRLDCYVVDDGPSQFGPGSPFRLVANHDQPVPQGTVLTCVLRVDD